MRGRLASGEASNAKWVPEGKYGNTKSDPVKEVGRHIAGRTNSVIADTASGAASNATWVSNFAGVS